MAEEVPNDAAVLPKPIDVNTALDAVEQEPAADVELLQTAADTPRGPVEVLKNGNEAARGASLEDEAETLTPMIRK
jgi:hypothetical protein